MGTSLMGWGSVGGGIRTPRRAITTPTGTTSTTTQQPAPTTPTTQQAPQQPAPAAPSASFAQLQQQGYARPAPQQFAPTPYTPGSNPITAPLSDAVQRALAGGSRYDLPAVQQVRDSLTGELQQQFGAQKKKLDEDLARRGISSSSLAGGYFGDLASNQASAMSKLNAELIQNAAASEQGDLSASLGAGQALQSGLAGQGLAERGQGLAETLGLGNLSIAQAQQALNERVQSGQLTIAQANQALDELKNQQQYGLAGRSQTLAEQLGFGGLGVQQQQANTASRAQQAEADYNAGRISIEQRDQTLKELSNTQQYGLASSAQAAQQSQFAQQLAQTLGLAKMQDYRTGESNTIQRESLSSAQNQWLLQLLAQLGMKVPAGTNPPPAPTVPLGGPSSSPGGGQDGDPNTDL